ncbi:MAG: hypothetical protein HZB37_12795 [Planctomycetes bacterium]|nr:hypothetical protein [Planctomycetota bacterium]
MNTDGRGKKRINISPIGTIEPQNPPQSLIRLSGLIYLASSRHGSFVRISWYKFPAVTVDGVLVVTCCG